MVKISGIIGVCGVLVCLATNTQAQSADTNTDVTAASVVPEGASDAEPLDQADEEAALRDDPFSLEGISETVPEASPAHSGFRPAESRPARMPEMVLRGIGRMNNADKPTALIDIKDFGLFIVKENDTISLQGIAGDNVLRIVEISEISVTVEAGSFGELIVVR